MDESTRDKLLIVFYTMIVPVIHTASAFLFPVIDYAVNTDFYDSTPPTTLRWWYFFSYNRYQTWLWVYDRAQYILTYALVVVIEFIACFFFVLYIFHEIREEEEEGSRDIAKAEDDEMWEREMRNRLASLDAALRPRPEPSLGELISAYERATQEKPEDASAWYNLGASHEATGELDSAIVEYEEAIRLDPTLEDVWLNLGNALYGAGEAERAINAYQKLLDLNPQRPNAWFNLGRLHQEKGDLQRAISAYERAVLIDPHPDTWYFLGNILYSVTGEDRKPEALFCWEKAIAGGNKDAIELVRPLREKGVEGKNPFA